MIRVNVIISLYIFFDYNYMDYNTYKKCNSCYNHQMESCGVQTTGNL